MRAGRSEDARSHRFHSDALPGHPWPLYKILFSTSHLEVTGSLNLHTIQGRSQTSWSVVVYLRKNTRLSQSVVFRGLSLCSPSHLITSSVRDPPFDITGGALSCGSEAAVNQSTVLDPRLVCCLKFELVALDQPEPTTVMIAAADCTRGVSPSSS